MEGREREREKGEKERGRERGRERKKGERGEGRETISSSIKVSFKRQQRNPYH